MNEQIAQKDFCFCTLALGERYQLMVRELAQNLQQYAPESYLVVGTDNPQIFQDCKNVIAFKHQQVGILHCFNDKRFVIANSLEKFSTAIFIDADTKITDSIPQTIEAVPGIVGYSKNMLEHLQKYRPQDVNKFIKVAQKLNINANQAKWIGESLFMVTRDSGKEKEFIKLWGIMANYLELQGVHSGEGSILGLAATKLGWQVQANDSLESINQTRKHLDASSQKPALTAWQQFEKRLGYHYRLNKTRIKILMNPEFR